MNVKIDITTHPRNIRSYTNQIANKDYEAASKDIAQTNAFFAAESIQKGNNENLYWQMILKGIEQLDLASLPSAKGPSDGLSMAEKIATYKFMDKAGLGTSASNQRQCRWFWKASLTFESGASKRSPAIALLSSTGIARSTPGRGDPHSRIRSCPGKRCTAL